MRIPVLTYHAMSVHGNDYATNDHVALAADLEVISSRGFEVRPLHELVDVWLADPSALEGRKLVAVTCDDGSDFDYRDLPHPTHGTQRSVLNILRDFQRVHPGAQPALHITLFAVIGPEIRRALDATCMLGKGWWNDDWWRDAVASGLLGIANHSWDHNHESLSHARPFEAPRGNFRVIDHRAAAEYEIVQADDYLARMAPNPARALFAYPYGHSNPYLADDFFPHIAAGRFAAAFTGDPAYWTRQSDRWRVPRFVCGSDWKSPAGLASILDGRFVA